MPVTRQTILAAASIRVRHILDNDEPSPPKLLLETGAALLLETGDAILVE